MCGHARARSAESLRERRDIGDGKPLAKRKKHTQQAKMAAAAASRALLAVRNILTFGVMITSKITSKAQTTIPQPVRAALGLKEGDEVVYEIDGDKVVLTKNRPPGFAEDPFAAFCEWNSDADTEDYADL
jgi:antitoxin PrlF